MKEAAVGIDIGGTNTEIGVVDREGKILIQASIPTQENNETVEHYVDTLTKKIEHTVAQLNSSVEIQGIGFGAPNGNYYNGTIEHAPNLRWKGIIKIVDMFSRNFDYKTIILTNDANAAAIGEMIYGAAKGMTNFILITLGTGLGSGIVVNGEIVYGHDGFAGEIGHTIAIPAGRECGCGRQGCLETYASATGIKRTVFELLAHSTAPSKLREVCFKDLTAKMISEAARNGDVIALDAFNKTGRILGESLADSVAHTSPEAIFLFGGLAQAGNLIFDPTRKYYENKVLNIYKNKVKISPSGLRAADAAILGSSALVWKELQ